MEPNTKSIVILLLGALFTSFHVFANATTPIADSLNYKKTYNSAYKQVNIDFDLAIDLAEESLTIADKLNDNSRKLKSLQLLFNFYSNNSRDLKLASNYLEQIKLIPQDLLTKREKASIHSHEAKFHLATHNLSKAITAIFKQLEELRGVYAPLEFARANLALGNIEENQSNHKEAVNYYKTAVQYFQQTNRVTGLALAYDALGASYGQLNDFRQNIYYDSIALSIADTLKAPFIKMNVLLNYGKAYMLTGQISKSQSLTNKAMSLAKRVNNQHLLAKAYNQLGAINELKNEPYKVKFFYKKGYQIAKELEDQHLLLSSYDHLHQFAIQQKNHKEAYLYLQKYTQAKDSLNNNKIKLQLAEQKQKSQYHQKTESKITGYAHYYLYFGNSGHIIVQ